ncbi:MAG: hypothetical protein M1822_003492 [Bathelium mastoideum]|nr:MAG: hypothetical protein M1822_003492 [Bathelium mastoideum]
MPCIADTGRSQCVRYLRACHVPLHLQQHPRQRLFSAVSGPHRTEANAHREDDEERQDDSTNQEEKNEGGAMSRRLEDMSEELLETAGRRARKAVEEAGFDEELKRKLEDRLAGAQFQEEHRSALAQAAMPTSAGKGSRDIAGAQPWRGEESVEDAALRMLVDAHKPMKGPARIPKARGPPPKMPTMQPKQKGSSGARLANARDKTSYYAAMKDPSMSEKEREQMRKELKERFKPAARAVPATIQGLASLANERIEDAIARGQFKNLPRGKKIERDYNASNPFLDTTEYFMNKIIQKQEIVPPWIEKQQELVSTATKFRSRLRSDWKRHAARLIASKGGSLPDQIQKAESFATAEAILNPSTRKEEKLNAVDDEGHLSQITLAGELKISQDQESDTPTAQITVTESPLDESAPKPSIEQPDSTVQPVPTLETDTSPPSSSPPTASPSPLVLFRDPTWEQTERSYHTLAIDNLNALTRSYNLMAPDLAKKPYFALSRELQSCYADVAPLVAQELRDRAAAPVRTEIQIQGQGPGRVLGHLGGGKKARVWDEQRPQYGFREFWRDLFGRKERS